MQYTITAGRDFEGEYYMLEIHVTGNEYPYTHMQRLTSVNRSAQLSIVIDILHWVRGILEGISQ